MVLGVHKANCQLLAAAMGCGGSDLPVPEAFLHSGGGSWKTYSRNQFEGDRSSGEKKQAAAPCYGFCRARGYEGKKAALSLPF